MTAQKPEDLNDDQLAHVVDHAYQARHGDKKHSKFTKEEADIVKHLSHAGEEMRTRLHNALRGLNRTDDDATRLDNFVDKEMFTADYDPYRDLMNNFDDEGNVLTPDDTIAG
ncbi:hypothetical protein [Bifidobacterium canis]|uniref:Uncharacterized protein n=1 Tax=Bifidobacterium canis TaxID=2610880 RepID=A0A7K1J4Y7_9BIFI|nr:hypothetical protein [Bifidobacterium canis]MUH59515.1 hypothetical protein [Bifidobacterium canis]